MWTTHLPNMGPECYGNPTTLGQIHNFPTSQPTIYLLSNTFSNMLGLVGSTQW